MPLHQPLDNKDLRRAGASSQIQVAVTHNARFHADDVFASAVIRLVSPTVKFIRTRDPDQIAQADLVFDVGDIHDDETLRFDHHQFGGAGERANGIPYASFGLVWRKFGAGICGSQEVADRVDARLVQAIDAMDNGLSLHEATKPGLHPYLFFNVVIAMNPTWKEDDTLADQNFLKVSEFAGVVLEREIAHAKAGLEARDKVLEAYKVAEDKRIVVIDNNYPYAETLIQFPEPLYVVRPNTQSTTWKVECVPAKLASFENRKWFPKSWGGKRDGVLEEATGVPGSIFCHNKRFLVTGKDKETCITLAKIAADAPSEPLE
jgi:uncharacterized UPF0160 family protein